MQDKTKGKTNLVYIARAKSSAHDISQRKIVSNFFRFCMDESPLRVGSRAGIEEKQKIAAATIDGILHLRSSAYDDSWFESCLIAQSRSRYTEFYVRNELNSNKNVQSEDSSQVWTKDENLLFSNLSLRK